MRRSTALQPGRRVSRRGGFPRWTWAWLSGSINRQQGRLDEAVNNLRSVLDDSTPERRERKFDFSLDYEVRNLLGQTLFDLGRQRSRQGLTDEADEIWRQAIAEFQKTLKIDPENVTAHHNLQLLYAEIGEPNRRPSTRPCTDVTSRTTTPRAGRCDWPGTYPAANHAAEAVAIYSLHRDGAPGLDAPAIQKVNTITNGGERVSTPPDRPVHRIERRPRHRRTRRCRHRQGAARVAAAHLLLLLVGGGVVYSLTRPAPPAPVQETELAPVEVREAPTMNVPSVPFYRRHGRSGDRFRPRKRRRRREAAARNDGGRLCVFRFDQDGDQDLLLVNSQRWPWDDRPRRRERPPRRRSTATTDRANSRTSPPARDWTCRSTAWAWRSATTTTTARRRFRLGGRREPAVSQRGDGQFQDVTEEAGVGGDPDAWSTSCGWFDYDRDGDLDLFVCNYVDWSREFDVAQNFQLTGGSRAYGRPQNFEGTFPYLYRNDGDGAVHRRGRAGRTCRCARRRPTSRWPSRSA